MIYLDNSATTKPKREVLDTYVKVSESFYGNPSSLHHIGIQAEKLLNQARQQIASLLGVNNNEMIFTSGGTEGNNMAIKSIALTYKNRGKHIITSSVEHPSVIEACEQLKLLGYEVTYLPVNHEGRINLEDLKLAIRPDTILVSVMHVNNEVGTIQPIKQIGEILSQYPKIFFHVDYVQGVGKVPLPLHDCHVDLATISAHKFHGLKGVGALYIRSSIRLQPLLSGGGQEGKLRSGTENVAGIVAMAKALRLTMERADTSQPKMAALKNQMREALSSINGVHIHTPIDHSAPHILNFSVENFKAEVLVHAIEEEEVFVSSTSACSSKLAEPSKVLLAMGVSERLALSSIRISLSDDTTEEDIRIAINVIKKSINKLQKIMRR
ncbi:cysteine desulfurase family protein [Bacillus kwashiorkori]|uniref:cysteine desulfurase family protein n=1 Tax=Bacillus kwashiorkori TaxID=1522318 RepID=UPI000780A0A4|nr:cysteine desulfurase family protein [Bacillus kwashiorkori]